MLFEITVLRVDRESPSPGSSRRTFGPISFNLSCAVLCQCVLCPAVQVVRADNYSMFDVAVAAIVLVL